MKEALRRRPEKPGIELIEEATLLVRTANASTLALYYAGAIPFVTGLLYFWADMSRSPYANQNLAAASLTTAALFIWMKFCQALFVRHLRAQWMSDEPDTRTLRGYVRILVAQAMIQPTGLFILPVALVLTVPFVWVYGFYQNVTALADPGSGKTSNLARKAWKQTLLWPRQNHTTLAILLLFGCFVFLSWGMVTFSVPMLLKMLFGVETVFSGNPLAMLNSTFFAAIFGLTYLTIDPLLKTIYALRCFYGESLQSGEDLKVDLKRFSARSARVAANFLLVFFLVAGVRSAAAQSGSSEWTEQLDHRIDDVIHSNKYAWRMPRDTVVEQAEETALTRFFLNIGGMARSGLRTLWTWIRRFLDRLAGMANNFGRPPGFNQPAFSLLLYGLLAAVISALGVFLYRIARGRRRPNIAVAASPIQPAPDVADENVSADQLPEDGWTRLARELMERGECRLALRAYYLASLAHLAHRKLIRIARSKSNRDYENELRRRGHTVPELIPMFGENVTTLERIWYGMHDVDGVIVREFAANVDRIRAAT
jgi:hypothetical protein